MSWDLFVWFALGAVLCWTAGAVFAWKDRPLPVYGFTLAGLAVFFAFILGMWISLERPPLRTMGETRLWYSFFLPLAGFLVYSRWRYKWILSFSTVLSLVFMTVAVHEVGATPTAIMGALEPLTAVAIGALVFGESLTFRLAVGIVLILSAVMLIVMKKQQHHETH